MRPVNRPKMSKKEAEQMRDAAVKAFGGIKKGFKNYKDNVIGGAKIVGKAIKSKLK